MYECSQGVQHGQFVAGSLWQSPHHSKNVGIVLFNNFLVFYIYGVSWLEESATPSVSALGNKNKVVML